MEKIMPKKKATRKKVTRKPRKMLNRTQRRAKHRSKRSY